MVYYYDFSEKDMNGIRLEQLSVLANKNSPFPIC